MAIVVRKYGGSSVSKSEQIKSIAQNIAEHHKSGINFIIVVSAMGDTTDELIDLSRQITPSPLLREMDMLLSAGERVSMALMSMALNDIGCHAISFTGSQAGILTNSSHSNAYIVDIRPTRVETEISKKNVVVLAGFQGICPENKEVTTLGRGGSDTTAVAMAAFFKADMCEMLKDVDGVYTADPRIVSNAKSLKELTYESLLEMTYWGSSVLHFRSVELAYRMNVSLFVGLSHGNGLGTKVVKETQMYEQGRVLSINSHSTVKVLEIDESDLHGAFQKLQEFVQQHQFPWLQILDTQKNDHKWQFLVTAPQEILSSYEIQIHNVNKTVTKLSILKEDLASVSLTCHGTMACNFQLQVMQILNSANINIIKLLPGSSTLSVFLPNHLRTKAIEILHSLVN